MAPPVIWKIVKINNLKNRKKKVTSEKNFIKKIFKISKKNFIKIFYGVNLFP